MPRARDQMTPGEWAVLALLVEGQTHGFAIARALVPEGEIGKVWSLPRPRAYYAIEALIERGLVHTAATVASRTGPERTMLRITFAGTRALGEWLKQPVEHVREARTLLLRKLLFLDRAGRDPRPLLRHQRLAFDGIVDRLRSAVDEARGFDRTLLRWRLENATAAVRFIDEVIDADSGSPGRCKPDTFGHVARPPRANLLSRIRQRPCCSGSPAHVIRHSAHATHDVRAAEAGQSGEMLES
jgi:DNA-binding PadR family transcriptional regulator